MKFLLVGLGNVGKEYENTRHNIGFKILDRLTKDNSISFELDRLAFVANFRYKSHQIVAIKPTTYMNLSGKALNYWMQKEKISIDNVLVIVDDIAIPFSTLRLKRKGSDGGHNGLKNIQEILGHNTYNRLRFGIGSEFHKGRQVDYVLGEWSKDEDAQLQEKIDKAVESIYVYITQGIDKAMMFANLK